MTKFQNCSKCQDRCCIKFMISDFKTVCNLTWLISSGVVVSSAKWITAGAFSLSLWGDFPRWAPQSDQLTILDKVRQMFYSWCLSFIYKQSIQYIYVCDMRLCVCVCVCVNVSACVSALLANIRAGPTWSFKAQNPRSRLQIRSAYSEFQSTWCHYCHNACMSTELFFPAIVRQREFPINRLLASNWPIGLD